MADDEDVTGRFLVTQSDDDSAVLSAVDTGRVLALESNPGLDVGDVVEGTLSAAGPLGVAWRLVEETDRWRPDISTVDEPPGTEARSLVAGRDVGELADVEIADGRLHAVAVDDGGTDVAVADLAADETTRRVAARLGARRVEVRGADGVVSVRYLT